MTDLFYAPPQVKKNAHGVKLIDFEKGKLTLSQEGTKILTSLDKHANVNVVFVFGNARSGKSFMMNALTGVPGLFKVVNSSEPCTRGVDMSSYIGKHDALAKVCGVSDTKSNPLISFVDVEGQGAEDGTYDTMLALPLLLTSKVVLFNHKGAPTVSDMLSKLGVLARAAEYIDLGDEKEKKAGEETKSATKKKFGHLHVLFRDFSFEGTRESVYEQLFTKEKVQKSLKPGPGAGIDQAKASTERNQIRQMLQENFESINVWLFKQPASADDLMKHQELPADKIDPEFAATVRELLTTATKQLGTPTLFNDQPLNGPRLHQLIGQVTTALNEGGVINVPSVYRAMEKETVNRVANECLALFELLVKATRASLPISTENFNGKMLKGKQSALDKFDDDLSECVLEDEKKNKKEEMLVAIAKTTDELRKDNQVATLKKLKAVITTEMNQVRLDFEAYCKTHMPVDDTKQLDSKFNILKEIGRKNVQAALADIPEALQTPEFQVMLLEAEETLQEFLTRKTIENESVIKDNTIEKLRLEAIKQQQKLIEQNKQLEKYLHDEKKTTEDMERELKKLAADNASLKAQDDDRAKKNAELIKKQEAELAELRKKKSKCEIL